MRPVLFMLLAGLGACEGCSIRRAELPPPGPVVRESTVVSAGTVAQPAAAPDQSLLPAKRLTRDDQAFYRDAAQTAWAFVKRNYQPTGLVRAHDTYEFGTLWDEASALAAIYSAHGLGIIGDAEYRDRMGRTLATLQKLPLYDNAAFNKMYSAESGTMIDRQQHRSDKGYGWSALDMGRLLVILHVIASGDPSMADAARAVAARVDMRQLVRDGYLQGADINIATKRRQSYQEGRIGYEQYAAEGFARWGARAEKALSFRENAKAVEVNGQTIYADKRRDDLLTSEPFVMMGLELGFPTAEWRDLAGAVLAAQEARWRSTGTVTMLSEDAIPQPPAYFYYYLLYRNGRTFTVYAPNGDVSDRYPRWVSTKAAFGWHALMPSAYTRAAVDAVRPAGASGRGWTSGVYEGTTRSTASFNLNSSALVLESAYYAIRGCPLAQASCPSK